MKHFQYSVMGLGILLRSIGWATKISGEISFSPPGTLAVTLWPVPKMASNTNVSAHCIIVDRTCLSSGTKT